MVTLKQIEIEYTCHTGKCAMGEQVCCGLCTDMQDCVSSNLCDKLYPIDVYTCLSYLESIKLDRRDRINGIYPTT